MRKAIRAIAVLLCAALLLPMFGCTGEKNEHISVDEIAEKYPGVKLISGDDFRAEFSVDLDKCTSFEWLKHLTTMMELTVTAGSTAQGGVENAAMADLAKCVNVIDLKLRINNVREVEIGEMPNVVQLDISFYNVGSVTFAGAEWLQRCWMYGEGVEKLDISALSTDTVSYMQLYGMGDCEIDFGDGVETVVFCKSAPDLSGLAGASRLKELQLLIDEARDLTPLASSESLHLLHLGICDGTSIDYNRLNIADIEWNLMPIVGSNIDTVLFGCALPTTLLVGLEGAENIRHLQINRRDQLAGIASIQTMPNLETVAVINHEVGYETVEISPDGTELARLAIKQDARETLRSFIEDGGQLMSMNYLMFDDSGDAVDYWGRSSTSDYYEWYYANVD